MRFLVGATCLLAALGCGFEAAFERATEHHDEFASQGSSGSTSAPPSGSTSSAEAGGPHPVNTVTGSSADTGTDTDTPADTGDPSTTQPDEAPRILAWTASAADVWSVGQVDLSAVVTADVIAVDVRENGELVTTLLPPALTYPWAVLGEAQDGVHTWTAVARSANASSAPADLVIAVDVPAGGQPLWHKVEPDPALSFAAAVAHVDQGALVVGYRQDGNNNGKLALRRYQGSTVAWTRSVDQWSKLPAMQGHSTGADVTLDPEGNIIVAGNLVAGPQSYVAKLDPAASKILWERPGSPGEIANGVAVDDDGRIYLAGSGPVAGEADTKLVVWSWDRDGLAPWLAEYEDTMDLNHLRSEKGTAVVRVGDRVIVVGEAELKDDNNEPYTRTVVVQVTPGGELKEGETWISPGDWGLEDGAVDVNGLGDEYCLTGWAGSPPTALTRCSDGLQPWWSTLHQPGRTARSLSHNQRLEVVVAGETATDKTGRAWIEALVPGGDLVAWTFTGNGADEHVYGIDCGTWGPCLFVGVSGLKWMAGALTP